MSGGSYNYMYSQIEMEYCERMYDVELNEMMNDLVKLLHDLEWWRSSDIDEETYRDSVISFKKKWFGRTKADVQKMIDEELEKKKDELMLSLGWMKDE